MDTNRDRQIAEKLARIRCRILQGHACPACVTVQSEAIAHALAEARAEIAAHRDAYEEARQRTRDYIVTAMRPANIAAACNEGLWERSHREGLKHALNALDTEFAKAESASSSSSSGRSR